MNNLQVTLNGTKIMEAISLLRKANLTLDNLHVYCVFLEYLSAQSANIKLYSISVFWPHNAKYYLFMWHTFTQFRKKI
jgi:hypothetical protein